LENLFVQNSRAGFFMSSFMNGISLRSFSRSLLVLLLLSFLISGLGFASNAGAQTPAGTPPIITFSFDPPAPVQSVEILPDGTLNPPYLCNPDPKINTGYLFRFLAGELDAFQNNEAPNATNLPSLESLLGQLKDRVTVESDKYSKTPAIPTGSTSVTLNDCYTDAEWKLFQTTFGQVACNWLRHFNAPHLCAPELQQQAASNPPVAPAVTVQDNTPPVITLNGPPEIVVEMGTTYTDKGATASDNIDGDITSRIKERYPPIDTSTLTAPRTYQLTYNVSDSAGNAATPVTRIVRVQDTTAPVITLKRTEPDIPKIYTVQVARHLGQEGRPSGSILENKLENKRD
jgi:hypothetical protein